MKTVKRLKRRLNSGMNKMYKNRFIPAPDRRIHISEGEIDYEGLCEVFLCCQNVIRYFVKAGVLPVSRKINQKLVFDKETAIKILAPYMVDGRLTLAKPKP